MRCAQCARPFVAGPSTRSCPNCGSARAASCRRCGTPIYLNGAVTCAQHGVSWLEGAGTVAEAPPAPPWSTPSWTSESHESTSDGRRYDLMPSRRRRRRWPAAVVALAVVAVAGTVAFVRADGDGHPKSWDGRITDLVAFVERERGLTFEHPVRVDFLSDAEFRELVTDREEPGDEERAQIESVEAMLRAVGFVTDDVDLASIGDELAGDGTVGLYDFDEQRIVVRGRTLDDERRSTLVHELTHALQDQRFGISERELENSGAQAAFTSVVEADAEMVEAAWVETLSAADREALAEAELEASAGADFEGVPAVFLELMGFPYVLGPGFLDAVVEERGQRGRNEVLRRLPTTEEHILLPDRYLSGDRARSLPTPALKAGETMVEDSDGDFGMLSLLVLLGERLDFSVAWPAVQGWAGDAVVAFERAGTTCVRLSVAFDDAAQAGRFTAAVTSWGEGLDTVKVAQQGDTVSVESCDPGAGGRAARADGHLSGIQGLGLRHELVSTLEGFGAAAPAATCIADGVIERLGADRLAELDRAIVEDGNTRAGREVEAVTAAVTERCDTGSA